MNLRKISKYVGLIMLFTLLLAQSASFGQGDRVLEFTLYGEEPVLALGEASEWDSGIIYGSSVLYVDGLFHMYYVAGSGTPSDVTSMPLHVGYASSADGKDWIKSENNPVLELETSFASHGVWAAIPTFDGTQWTLYLAPRYRPGGGASLNIITASATSPAGPWEVNSDIILAPGSGRDWDSATVLPVAVETVDNTHLLFFVGGGSRGVGIGLATSQDGEQWEKTTSMDADNAPAAFRNSVPVFTEDETCGQTGFWPFGIPFIHHIGGIWEVFYSTEIARDNGAVERGICYATSDDGIQWVSQSEQPIFSLGTELQVLNPGVVVVDDTYYLYFASSRIWTGNEDTPHEIWLATGSVSQGDS